MLTAYAAIRGRLVVMRRQQLDMPACHGLLRIQYVARNPDMCMDQFVWRIYAAYRLAPMRSTSEILRLLRTVAARHCIRLLADRYGGAFAATSMSHRQWILDLWIIPYAHAQVYRRIASRSCERCMGYFGLFAMRLDTLAASPVCIRDNDCRR